MKIGFGESLLKGIIKVIRAGKPAKKKVQTERRKVKTKTHGRRPTFRGQEEKSPVEEIRKDQKSAWGKG